MTVQNSNAQLPALKCSVGGFAYNREHIDYWKSRAEAAERQLEQTRAALGDLVETLTRRVDIQPLLGFHEDALIQCARAVLQDRAPEKQWIRGHVEGSSPTTGNGDEP